MFRTSLVLAATLFVVLAVGLLRSCAFLFPLRAVIWRSQQRPILAFALLLIFNLWAAAYAVVRRLTLKDTGAKLAHLEKQLRGRTTMAKELTDRILEER